MQARLNHRELMPELMNSLIALNKAVDECGLEKSLLHLIKLRASQINGCSFCVDMHSREARNDGDTEQRLYLVSAWRESPLFSARERAALDWVESVTRISDHAPSDQQFAAMQENFADAEIAKLTVAIGMINIWNRLSVSFQVPHPVTAQAAE